MNEILKQRLVGALILLALGVVFWPIVFVQPENRPVAEHPSIPPAPVVATEPIAIPDAAELRASQPLAADGESVGLPSADGQASSPVDIPATPATTGSDGEVVTGSAEEQPTRQEPPQKLSMDSDGVPMAWTLQVATVSAADKAEELRRKLLEMNQKAYVAKVTSGGKTLYRVCIGPKFERIELEKLQPGINARFGVNTMVVRYIP